MGNSDLGTIQERLLAISDTLDLLRWDRSVMMPDGGAGHRADTCARVEAIYHESLTSSEVGVAIDEAAEHEAIMDPWQRANLRELRNERAIATALPVELVMAIERSNVHCQQIWQRNREQNNWNDTVASLSEAVRLQSEKADILGETLNVPAYDALMNQWQPKLTQKEVDPLFERLKSELPRLTDDVIENQGKRLPISDHVPVSVQRDVGSTVAVDLGYDFSRGRLDTSHHPFSCGSVNDARITTRYDERNFAPSLYAIIHETGHAMYTQGLPIDRHSEVAGRANGMALHESQSLFMEKQVGHSDGFLSYLQPLICSKLGISKSNPLWSLSNLKANLNWVQRDFIRVDADELTYPLHICLRYELEKLLLSGQLDARDLPDAWDQFMTTMLGLSTQGNYRDGVMQDIHWYSGAWGYFPTYTIGALTAAQLFETFIAEHGSPQDDFAQGDFSPVVHWLRENVHQQGRLYEGLELVKQATGKTLSLEPFLRHLRTRYLEPS